MSWPPKYRVRTTLLLLMKRASLCPPPKFKAESSSFPFYCSFHQVGLLRGTVVLVHRGHQATLCPCVQLCARDPLCLELLCCILWGVESLILYFQDAHTLGTLGTATAVPL